MTPLKAANYGAKMQMKTRLMGFLLTTGSALNELLMNIRTRTIRSTKGRAAGHRKRFRRNPSVGGDRRSSREQQDYKTKHLAQRAVTLLYLFKSI